MKGKSERPGLPWGWALVLVFLAGASQGWCPEAPLLASLPAESLRANLAPSPGEVLALLGNLPAQAPDSETPAIINAVYNASRTNGLPPELLLAVIGAESSFRGRAISGKGAMGLMQLMPGTAAEVASQMKIPWTGDADLYDPGTNINMGAYYLTKQLTTFRNLDVALAAYNRGPYAPPLEGASSSWHGETGTYVRRVRDLIARHARKAPGREFGAPQPFEVSSSLAY